MKKSQGDKAVKGLTEEQQAIFNGLTTLQKGMVIHTLKGKKPSEAHRLAGGKCKDETRRANLASEILLVPAVAGLVAKVRADVALEAKVDAAFILKAAKHIHDRCVQEIRPLTFQDGTAKIDENGNQIYAFDAKAALSALKLIGDHIDVQAFKQITETKHTFENIDDDDLDQKIKRLMASVNSGG